jgi:hypothetical protein
LYVLLLFGCSSTETVTPTLIDATAILPDPQIPNTLSPTLEATEEAESVDDPEPSASPTIDQSKADNELSPQSYFGVEINGLGNKDTLDLLRESGVELVRINGVRWQDVEPEHGVRDWDVLDDLDNTLAYLGEKNIPVILIVRGAPLFAQKVSGYYCGPIAEDAIPAFVDFLEELVQRYSQPPYHVKYWELGNEPDVEVGLTGTDSPYGCLGDASQPDYGGADYAKLLKQAYPAIRSIDPEAKVLIGGLLLDCDPTNPPKDKTCQPAKYLEGILANGGGDYFDIVSYHGYPPYFEGKVIDETFVSWDERGGVILGKLDFIQEVLEKFNLDKPIFHTESALVCPDWNPEECDPPTDKFYASQAQFVPRLYLRNWAHGIDGTIWFTFDGKGFRHGGMLGSNTSPNRTLLAYQYLVKKFKGARYIGENVENPGIVIFTFEKDNQHIWSVWSLDWQSHPYTLPEGVTEVADIFGNLVEVENGQVDVDEVLYLTFENQ